MTRHADSPKRPLLALGLICVLSGALLGGVYTLTAEPIAKARDFHRTEAIAAVAPPFTNSPADEAVTITLDGDTRAVTVYPAFDGDSLVGAAVSSWSLDGFSGEIDVMMGFNADGSVRGFSVMSQKETPGLGARMAEWFAPGAPGDISGIKPDGAGPTVSKDGGTVDGITAATISSRAFLQAVRRAAVAYGRYRAELTGEPSDAPDHQAVTGASKRNH
ncbi:MAG: RnfABCDGE type electron transport complex subunit G [Candidatus Amulumruptor caecigallinarius]|nr:RnfABCDGE type electron transport complex subunit G [Candidatus Amulumruptor caecigallinarius]MCM1396843.1 RnfABCDGE type electron transport complex subunit G [Candidatus Amulumruptor caecigallinarius]MCM1454213.1 RnfABCDGE type electron transport complex subunit G [bacterium]